MNPLSKIIFSLIPAVFLSAIIFYSCTKEPSPEISINQSGEKMQKDIDFYLPGKIYETDDYLIWIDPSIYFDPVPANEIFYRDANHKGKMKDRTIECYGEGSKCGSVCVTYEDAGVQLCGYYLIKHGDTLVSL